MAKYWIKLYHEILDDPKMGRLPDRLYRRVIELFLLAGELDEGGYLPNLEDMAWRLRTGPEFAEELQAIEQTGIITYDTDCLRYFVTKFATRQDASTEAERKSYQRQRDRKETASVTKRDNTVTHDVTIAVRELDTDTDTDTDTDIQACMRACETATGYPVRGTPEDLAALREMVLIGATVEDIQDAVAFFVSKGKVARNPAQILASVRTAHAKRVQAGARSIPVPEPYAAEVYGD